MSAELKGLLLGALAVFIFALTLPATRYLTLYLAPNFIGFGRACFAALVALIILVLTRQPLPNMEQSKNLALVALGVVIGFPLLSAWAMQSLPASHGGVVMGVLPLATAAASRLVSEERPSVAFWIVGALGSCLVISYALLQGGGKFLPGDLALICAVISAAIGYAVGGELAKELGGWQVICWALLFSVPFIIWPTIVSWPDNFSAVPLTALMAFFYLALFSQLFGFFFWYKAMAIGGVARVSQMQLVQPFITIIASALLLQEGISWQTASFAVAVVLLVALGKRMPIDKSAKQK